MARGKYANRAEAARARETAQQEAARLRRENERLQKENAELMQSLNDTIATMHTETARLRLIAVSGSSEKESQLAADMAALEQRLANARREVGLEIMGLYQEYSLPVPVDPKAAPRFIKALSVTPAEFFGDYWGGNRKDRRTTADDVARNIEENQGWGTKQPRPPLVKVADR